MASPAEAFKAGVFVNLVEMQLQMLAKHEDVDRELVESATELVLGRFALESFGTAEARAALKGSIVDAVTRRFGAARGRA